jgi:hypothetical protein
MLNENLHPTDQELLLFADGEIRRRHTARIRGHLAACWACRARMAEIESTIADFVRVHQESLDPKLPSIAGPRALLRAQLAGWQKKPHNGTTWHLGFPFKARRLVPVCALALFLVLGIRLLYLQTAEHLSSARVYAGLLPDRSLTPGATRPVTIGDICTMDHDEVIHPVPSTLRQMVFREYGIREGAAEKYEVDYLITPGLGGTGDVRNLWPEPRYNTIWNSFVKDQLEDYLHRSVCSEKLSLASAQKDLASDWISAYKKYFHTNKPLFQYSKANPTRSDGLNPCSQILSCCGSGICDQHDITSNTLGSPTLLRHRAL